MIASLDESSDTTSSCTQAAAAAPPPAEVAAPSLSSAPAQTYAHAYTSLLSMPMNQMSPAPYAPPVSAPMHAHVLASLGRAVAHMPLQVAGRNALIRKEWTEEEDSYIRRGVHAGKGWRAIANQLPGRSDDAVRNRWKRLDPNRLPSPASGGIAAAPTDVVKGPKPKGDTKPKGERVTWSPTEDALIVGAVHECGHKWGLIAQKLPGRTEHAIRNRYQRLLTISVAAKTT